MLDMIKLELLKFKKNPTIRLLIVFYAVFFPLGFLFAKEIKDLLPVLIKNQVKILEFPRIWDYMGYGGSWLVFFFLGVVMIYIIGMEVRFKTMRQSIINGMTRKEFFISKMAVLFSLAFLATAYYAILCFCIGFFFTENAMSHAHENLIMIPRYFLMSLGFLSFAAFLAFGVRKSGLAMFIYFSTIMIIEPVIRWGVHGRIEQNEFINYYPIEAISDLVPNPFWSFTENIPSNGLDFQYVLPGSTAIILSILYICLFIGLSYRVFYKRDI